jgi:hypothetical protein
VLLRNKDRIGDGTSHIWPIGVLEWDQTLPLNCRQGLIEAAVGWMISDINKASEAVQASIRAGTSAGSTQFFTDYLRVLDLALADEDVLVRAIAAGSLDAYFGLLDDDDEVVFTPGAGEPIRARELRTRVDRVKQEVSNARVDYVTRPARDAVHQWLVLTGRLPSQPAAE